jgi:transcriptional regulator with XRE-family HTH domain
MKTASDVIKEIVYKGELTQAEIAVKIGVQQATISRLRRKKNKISYRTACRLVKLAKNYKIDVSIEEIIPTE